MATICVITTIEKLKTLLRDAKVGVVIRGNKKGLEEVY